MKNTYTKKLVVAIFAVNLGFISSSAFASKEDIQSRASEQIRKLQQQIKATEASKQSSEATKATECKRLEEQGKKC